MRWNNAATWQGTMAWTNSDDMGVITSVSEVVVNPFNPAVDTIGLINALLPVGKLVQGGLTDTTELTDFIPAGTYLDKVLMVNTAGTGVTIKAGTTAGDDDIFTGTAILAGGYVKVSIDQYFSTLTTIYLTFSVSTATVDIHFLTWKI